MRVHSRIHLILVVLFSIDNNTEKEAGMSDPGPQSE